MRYVGISTEVNAKLFSLVCMKMKILIFSQLGCGILLMQQVRVSSIQRHVKDVDIISSGRSLDRSGQWN